MPFPDVDPLIETFLEPSRIFLFGKPFPTLTYDPSRMSAGNPKAGNPADEKEFETFAVTEAAFNTLKDGKATEADLPMPPGPVERTLREAQDDGQFARIYGFSFEGHYYKLPRPILFLVRGEGSSKASENEPRFDTRFTGVESKDWQFGNDIRVWAVDKHEIAVCLDIEVGTYDQVLLQSMIAGQDESTFRTAGASRGTAMASRTAATFRTAMLGPHQDR